MIGIVSDIHGNKQAFQAVLDAMPSVETLVCCGDIVGYGAHPRWCLRRVQEEADIVVCGNHDTAVVNDPNRYHNAMAAAGIQHARTQLQHDDYQWLTRQPRQVDDSTNLIFHAHPDDIEKRVTPEHVSDGFASYFSSYERLLYGHTHLPTVQTINETTVINPGSVGQPRDGDQRASFAVLHEDGSADVRRVQYDVDAAQDAILDADLPKETAERLARGV